MWKVGIDTGGTFTDIVAVRGDDVRTAKVSSTPPDFEEGVLESIRHLGIEPSEIAFLAHGTTATTNATITKTGARTGLITTEGFRDVLELRRHNRAEIYDVLWDPPEPLVPRQLRLEVKERIDYSGKVVTPLVEEDVHDRLEQFRDYGIDSLAVCFLNSYENPVHEERVREIVTEAWPELYLSISSELIREPQEFERTSTTVVNAYVGPILSGYVGRLQDGLRDQGFDGTLMIMHSGGGLLPAESVVAVPARTLTSGPAAGAMAAEGFAGSPDTGGDANSFSVSGAPAAGAMAVEGLAAMTGIRQIISLDIGGTSADIGVVRNGKTRLINEYVPEFGLPIRFPAVDLSTIGAGGGSIAWVDSAGAARSGPMSAGARPGPACYGMGGEEPTLTDANLVLGRLSPETRLGGELGLDLDLGREAVASFAGKLGLSVEDAALGILEITNSNMAKAIRVMTVERGLDPRDFVLLPFGGAGPMMACELAETLSIGRVLIPISPGVLSALGTLFVDVIHDFARSRIEPVSELDPDEIEQVFRELEADARAALEGNRIPSDRQVVERSLDLRYVGQVKTLNIPFGNEPFSRERLDQILGEFFEEYERQYHYITHDIPVEVAVVRVRGRGLQEKVEPPVHRVTEEPEPFDRREVTFRGKAHKDVAVYHRDALGAGYGLTGPLIVEQLDSTTVVPPGWELGVDKYGNLELERA